MERRAMKTGMRVLVRPPSRRVLYPRYPAHVVELPDRPRGKVRVRFGGGRSALVPLWRIIKP